VIPVLVVLLAVGVPSAATGVPESGSQGPAQFHPEVLLIVNRQEPRSLRIAAYYQQRRGVPAANRIELDTAPDEAIGREVFERDIREPIEDFLSAHGLADQVEILVTTFGVPLVVFDGLARASVDAELALLFSGQVGDPIDFSQTNPYLGSSRRFREFRRRFPDANPRFLVARLTGYATEIDPTTLVPVQIKNTIDAAQAEVGADDASVWVLDEDPTQAVGNERLDAAADRLGALGVATVHDTTPHFVTDVDAIAGYASWGSNDRNSPEAPYYGDLPAGRSPGVFAARAVALDFVSSNARSFREPPEYGQSLVADLLVLGAAGVAGHVFEPTLQSVAFPDLLLPYYAAGVPAAEAFFRSHPQLGWANVWIGDPLMTVATPVPEPAAPLAVLAVLAVLYRLRPASGLESARRSGPGTRAAGRSSVPERTASRSLRGGRRRDRGWPRRSGGQRVGSRSGDRRRWFRTER